MGYGGWSLYFDPRIVQAVIDIAAQLPETGSADEAYRHVCHMLGDVNMQEPSQFVFPNVVEEGTGRFRKSDLPAVVVEASSDWVECPFCDWRFRVSDDRRWDGERHLTCGQRIIVHAA